MAHGGARPGAGRPQSAERKPAKPAKPRAVPAKRGGARPGSGRKKKLPVVAALSTNGVKDADAPPNWPFGTLPPQIVVLPPVAPEVAPSALASPNQDSPLDYLLKVMRDVEADQRVRLQAAALAAPFVHLKPSEVGKKAAKADAAKSVGSGRFAPAPTPLKLVNR